MIPLNIYSKYQRVYGGAVMNGHCFAVKYLKRIRRECDDANVIYSLERVQRL